MAVVQVRTRGVLFPILALLAVLALTTAADAQEDASWSQIGVEIEANDVDGAFSRSIDVNADGTRMVVGAPHSDVSGFNSGQARVFNLDDGAWSQVGQDINGDTAFDALGNSVAISGDGSRIVVGIQQGGSDTDRPGIARVFDLVDDAWAQVGNDIVGESENDQFGQVVAISGNGSRLAVAAPWNNGNLTRSGGHVRVYRLLDGAWIQTGGDIDGRGVFGVSISLSADGSRLVAGESGYSDLGVRRGRVRAFQMHNGAWVQIGQDIVGEADEDSFGLAADISGDGSTIVTGAPFNDGGGDRSGHVRVYGLFNWTWIQIGPDIDGAPGEWMGWDVSISSDGSRVAAGLRVTSRTNAGLARIYELDEGAWLQVGDDVFDGSANGTLVEEVSLSADGTKIAVGATDLDEFGVARLFAQLAPEPPIVDPPPGPPAMCGGVEATIVGTPGDDLLYGTDGPDVIAGLQGDDTIHGWSGDDILCGGKGDDVLYGGLGFDIMYGAQGDDVIFSAGGETGALRADARGMRAFGGAGDDTIYGSDRWDRMQGGPGRDQMFGYEGRDWMRGGADEDTIDGGAGVDDLHGGNANDVILLAAGDTVRGGAGPFDVCHITGTPKLLISCEQRD